MNTYSNVSSTDIFSKINKAWMLILIFAISGAIIAFVIAIFFVSPIYISISQTSVAINFKEIGHISQYEQDQYIGLVEALYLSDDVIQRTLESLEAEGITLNKETFKENSILERQSNLIVIKYTSKNGEIPQKVVSTWSYVAYSTLTEAYVHAVNYQNFVNLQQTYLTCFENTVQYSSTAHCEPLLETIPSSQTILEEKFLSRGIFPGLTFHVIDKNASTPTLIRNQTNLLVISGFFGGFILALIYILFFNKRSTDYENINPKI